MRAYVIRCMDLSGKIKYRGVKGNWIHFGPFNKATIFTTYKEAKEEQDDCDEIVPVNVSLVKKKRKYEVFETVKDMQDRATKVRNRKKVLQDRKNK